MLISDFFQTFYRWLTIFHCPQYSSWKMCTWWGALLCAWEIGIALAHRMAKSSQIQQSHSLRWWSRARRGVCIMALQLCDQLVSKPVISASLHTVIFAAGLPPPTEETVIVNALLGSLSRARLAGCSCILLFRCLKAHTTLENPSRHSFSARKTLICDETVQTRNCCDWRQENCLFFNSNITVFFFRLTIRMLNCCNIHKKMHRRWLIGW